MNIGGKLRIGMNHAVITCLRVEITKCGKERIITDLNVITGEITKARARKYAA